MDKILDIICCPKCKNDLILKNEKDLFCKFCNFSFLIKNNIIILVEKGYEF